MPPTTNHFQHSAALVHYVHKDDTHTLGSHEHNTSIHSNNHVFFEQQLAARTHSHRRNQHISNHAQRQSGQPIPHNNHTRTPLSTHILDVHFTMRSFRPRTAPGPGTTSRAVPLRRAVAADVTLQAAAVAQNVTRTRWTTGRLARALARHVTWLAAAIAVQTRATKRFAFSRRIRTLPGKMAQLTTSEAALSRSWTAPAGGMSRSGRVRRRLVRALAGPVAGQQALEAQISGSSTSESRSTAVSRSLWSSVALVRRTSISSWSASCTVPWGRSTDGATESRAGTKATSAKSSNAAKSAGSAFTRKMAGATALEAATSAHHHSSSTTTSVIRIHCRRAISSKVARISAPETRFCSSHFSVRGFHSKHT